ncbi:pectinesterase/pectinesterase inhibitor PPE8B isoform X2 [Telopea speciosissima]|uniref:pectinesterase/pectinesterase inhibitor PPE8B isoform X2 n=1 Tax=Telopea speciosissima TaxID=54955 RepID=UPI001CC763D6|nr:pectinesterase/pectinesterase inhibitor PPE8B isoform X2 [Telopea speciosissima]
MLMAPRRPISTISLLFLVLLLLLLLFSSLSSSPLVVADDYLQAECFNVPSSDFIASVKSTIDVVRKVTSLVSKFANALYDFRLSTAINDCVDLLDFSADELSLTLSASQNPSTEKDSSTGNRVSDMRTWLSAALGNQDTCMEGFQGTSSFVEGIVGGSLGQVTSLVSDLLAMLRPHDTHFHGTTTEKKKKKKMKSSGPAGRKLLVVPAEGDNGGFPAWVKTGERRLLQQQPSLGVSDADVVVAADGSGNYTRVMHAIEAAPDNSTRRYVIYVKKGVYRENVDIKKKKWNLMIIGDGMDLTVISGNRSYVDGWTTFRTATFAVSGRGFIARDLTFENTAGPQKHQAVALRSDSDLSVFFRCGIRGYQDTLYAHSLRQFYRECHITGTVDFIFGNGAVVFQNCQILAKKALPDQKNSITAQGRKDPGQNTGFSIQFSNISADSDLLAAGVNSTLTYLGRPWKLYSRTVFMQSYISSVVRPEGWLEWQGNFALDTLFYGEYRNYGPGAALGVRVKWPGFRAINDSTQASNFTVAQFIDGNMWLPSTGVKYTAGLTT